MRYNQSLLQQSMGSPMGNFMGRSFGLMMCMGLALCLVMTTGCTEEIKGSAPTIDEPSQDQTPLPAEPGIVCSEQLTTDVVLTGGEFSPLVIDVLEEDSRIDYPDVTLNRSQTLTGDEADGEEILYSGDPDEPINRDLLSWQSQEKMTFTVHQELELADGSTGVLPSGIHDITVRNANEDHAMSQGTLAVAPRPKLDDIGPSIVCLAEEERTVSLSGETFLEIEGDRAHVEIDGVDDPFDIEFDDGDCNDVAHNGIDARVCDRADMALQPGSLSSGYPELTLQNPPTAQCHSEDVINLRVVPPPVISSIVEPMACVAQGERTFEIHGSDFLHIDEQTPTVTVDGTEFDVTMSDCNDLETLNHDVEVCSTMTMVVGENAVDPGRLEVAVSNPPPAGCSNEDSAFVTITPPPAVDEVAPPAVCVQDGPRQVTIEGSDFITVGGTVPEVEIDGVAIDAADISPQECGDLEVDDLDVQTCDELLVTVTEEELGGELPYNPDITVTNPDPAGCDDTESDLLTVMEGPTIDAAEPALACTDDGSREVVLTGTNFLTVGGEVPGVSIDGTDIASEDITADGCDPEEDVAGELDVENCTTLTVDVEQGLLESGDVGVVVTNPDPVGCDVSNTEVLTAPPTLTVSSVQPPSICISDLGEHSVEINGTGFLNVDGEWFDLEIGGEPIAVTDSDVSGCSPLTVDGHSVESCDTIVVDFDTTGEDVGPIDISIANPGEATCGDTVSDQFSIAAPPTVNTIEPTPVCEGEPTTFTLTGEDFVPGMEVRAHHSDSGTLEADNVTFVSSTEVEAEFASGLDDGNWDIEVDSGGDCSSTATELLTVNPTPVVFFVDPPVLFNGITTEVTIFTSGLSEAPASINFVDSDDEVTPITSYSSAQPNRIQATVPSGLDPDNYEVEITSDLGCVGSLAGAVEITDETTVAVDGIDPIFGWQDDATGVTITADEEAAEADQFQATPRVYLNPVDGGAGSTAIELRATTFDSSTELSGIVPSGFSTGEYDIIVVNPDGSVGVLTDPDDEPEQGAFTVLEDAPPLVDSIEPGTWPDNEITDGSITGEHFRIDDAVNDTPVTAECLQPDGSMYPLESDALTVRWADFEDSSTTIPFRANLNNTEVAKGSTCVVRVTNTDETFAEFSPVAISWPAAAWRIADFLPGPELTVGRRAPAVATGEPSRKQRFLYAIGGDAGDTTDVHESVEFSRLDRFGHPTGFSELPRHSLPPGGITLTKSVTIGEFIYLVGGYKGSDAAEPGATGEVSRAKILDPLNVPNVSNVTFEIDEGNGLSEGTYYYRVSAVLDADSYNPDGETLASEPLPISVPETIDGDLVPTIVWDAFPDADSYRIYRSPSPDISFGNEELFATVTDDGSTSYSLTDDDRSPISSEQPLPVGSLGEWDSLDPGTDVGERHSHGVSLAPDPQDSDLFHIYAVGGLDDQSEPLGSIDFVSISVAGPRDQIVSAITLDAATLDTPRFELEASSATAVSANNLDNPPFLYVMGGQDGAGLTSDTNYYPVEPGGGLGAGQDFAAQGIGFYSGYVGLVANNRLIMLHGEGGNANAERQKSTGFEGDGDHSNPFWTPLDTGGSIEARYLPGRTARVGMLYVLGGVDGAGEALQSTDHAVVGATSQ